MSERLLCGEALVHLLEAYGVDTVFGIPGVHTLDLYRGLAGSAIRHVQSRNEQGAGFMADGYARVSGRAGVCTVISGPGVTNALTAIGQAYADSIPVLMISSDAASDTLGKGWGALHEVPRLTDVTAPLTGFSATAMQPADVPVLIGQAFSLFASTRPRPVHIAVPLDVLAMPVEGVWHPVAPPSRALPDQHAIERAAQLLAEAENPMLYVGGGAVGASRDLVRIAELLDAPVLSSNAGKGVVPDNHPLALGGAIVRAPAQDFLGTADVVLAIGTELAETDSFVHRLPLPDRLIRIDIDARKINDLYPAQVGLVADAAAASTALWQTLRSHSPRIRGTRDTVAELRRAMRDQTNDSEKRHLTLLDLLRKATAADTVIAGDISQLVYTGSFAFDVDEPRLWNYPAGYCTLGCGLPNAIGGMLALPGRPFVVLAGDGGFMFTVQELVTAAELGLALPIVIWNNGGLKQIQDDMRARNIPLLGVDGMNPDFVALARACGCNGIVAQGADHFVETLRDALTAKRPTLIEVHETAAWLS